MGANSFLIARVSAAFLAVAAALPLSSYATKDWTKRHGQITVDRKDGKTAWSVVGYSDIEARIPMDTNALFWVASVTKGVAAALVLTYVDEGKIRLDDPVERYIPAWRDICVVVTNADGTQTRRPPKSKPTMRQVLSHMSGLAFFPERPIDRYSMQELAELAVERGLVSDPGTEYCYSNWGIDVAVAVVEKIAGRPWEDMLKERILDPLGMSSATFWPTLEEQKRIVVPYYFPGGGKTPVRLNGVTQFSPYIENRHLRHAEAGGGLYATVGDFVRFFHMVAHRGVSMEGRRILSDEICQEWYRRQSPPHVKTSYSFGMRVNPAAGIIGHGGAYATQGTVNWKKGTYNIQFSQRGGRPKPPPETVSVSSDGSVVPPKSWDCVAGVKTVLQKYAAVLKGPDEPLAKPAFLKGPVSSAETCALLKRGDGCRWLFAVNTEDAPMTVRFPVSAVSAGVAEGVGAPVISPAGITDTLPPRSLLVYKVEMLKD